jgi:6-phosphogluconolactonase (cycloisomerase 2 family)
VRIQECAADPRVQLRNLHGVNPLKLLLVLIAALGATALSGCNLKYSVGGKVTGLSGSGLVLADSDGTTLAVSGNGTFVFPTGIKNGLTYTVSVNTQPTNPTQTCTVFNDTGTIAKAAITHVIVNCVQAAQYAWIANQGSNNLSGFAIDSSSGFLTALSGSPFPSNGTTPTSIAVDPNGLYAYVANNGSNNVSVYSIDATTGVLTADGFTTGAGSGPVAVLVDPSDSFVYVANQASNDVSAYTINSSNGTLTAMTGSPFLVGNGPIALQTDPGGNYLYVVNYTDGTVSVLAIDSVTGALTTVSGSPFPSGTKATSIAIDSTGQFAYVANTGDATISAFSITADSGALVDVTGSPFSAGTAVEAVAADPIAYTGSATLYAANSTTLDSVATFGIGAGGELTSASAVVNAGALPDFAIVDPAGTFLYVADDNSNDVRVYSIDASSGALNPVTGSPFGVGTQPHSIALH